MLIKSSSAALRRTLCALHTESSLGKRANDHEQKSVTKCRESQKARLNLKMRLGLDKKSLIFIDQNRKPALFSSSNKQSARAFGSEIYTW